jgi:hypothetical protein
VGPRDERTRPHYTYLVAAAHDVARPGRGLHDEPLIVEFPQHLANDLAKHPQALAHGTCPATSEAVGSEDEDVRGKHRRGGRSGGGERGEGVAHLADALQCLQIVLGLVVGLVDLLAILPHCAGAAA